MSQANTQAILCKRCWCGEFYDLTHPEMHQQHFSHQLKVQARSGVHQKGTIVRHVPTRRMATVTGNSQPFPQDDQIEICYHDTGKLTWASIFYCKVIAG